MNDYSQIEDYDCPKCAWSLHVETRVWNEIDNHPLIINYIHKQVSNHYITHNLAFDIGDSPYLYVSPKINK